MVADFHRRGVKVLFPMMMWDQSARDEGKGYPQALAEFMKQIGADGIDGDTQDGVPLAFSLAAEKAGHPLAFDPENYFADEAISWDVLNSGGLTRRAKCDQRTGDCLNSQRRSQPARVRRLEACINTRGAQASQTITNSFGIGIFGRRQFSDFAINGGQAFENDIQLDGLSTQSPGFNE